MYYKLKKDYMLRGWKLLPTGVINRETRDFKFLPGKKFSVLKSCTGLLDSDSVLFNDEQRKIMEELRTEGYVEANENASPLEDGQEYKYYDNRFMRSAHWSITGKCNCNCRHCYMSAPQHKVEEFTHEQCMDIIAQMAECGIQEIQLTGGEALVRKDFWEIVDALMAADIRIEMIYSNGFLINEKFIAELEKRNLRPTFQISFDGVGGCHDWLRGFEGAERLALRAIELLSKKNFIATCAFEIHRDNAPYLRATVKKLAEVGAKYLRVAPITAAGEALDIKDKILSIDELYNILIDYIPQYIADGAPIPLSLMGIFEGINSSEYTVSIIKHPNAADVENHCVCDQVRNSIHIDFEGLVMPCPPMSFNEPAKKRFSRIFDKSLKEHLVDGAYMSFINTRMCEYFKANPKCAACKYKNLCHGGCRGLAMANNGDDDLFGVDKTTCKFFRGGYYERVIEVASKLNLRRINMS